MVAGDSVDEAVAIAKKNPKLGVGLHLVLIDGPAVLPRERIADLVDERGLFPNSPARLGMRYTLSRRVRTQLEAEIEAQFQRFASVGIPLSHVDGHQHMHLLPAVFPIVARLAKKYGAHGIRIVRDDLRLALRHDRSRLITKMIWGASFKWMAGRALRHLYDVGSAPRTALCASPEGPQCGPYMLVADQVYGLMQTGRMSVRYVDMLLHFLMQHPNDDLVEIYFHPTLGPRLDEFGPNPDEFQTLIDPEMQQLICTNGFELTTYRDAHNIFPLIAEGGSPGCCA